MRNALGIVALILFFAATQPTKSSEGGIESQISFNPGAAVPQDCQSHRFTVYTADHAGRLVALDLWMGLYRNAYADLTTEVYVKQPSGQVMLLGSFREDRYQNPDGIHQRFISFAPSYITINPGAEIFVNALNCWVAGTASPMHPTVDLYLSDAP